MINSRMNLQENKIFTLDDGPEILVNQLAFLSILTAWKKGLDNLNDLTYFFKQVDAAIPKAADAFERNEKGSLIKLNSLVIGKNKPLNASKEPVTEMAYQKPNFETYWDRVRQNSFINALGVDNWIELANTGRASKISKPSLDNILDYDPSMEAKPNLNSSHVNMPMILKTPMGDYHLLSGNAELNGIMDMHGNAKVWYIDGSKVGNENI